jgi:hypothetical protein
VIERDMQQRRVAAIQKAASMRTKSADIARAAFNSQAGAPGR